MFFFMLQKLQEECKTLSSNLEGERSTSETQSLNLESLEVQ